MIAVITWRTDDPCPACGTGLTLHDDGMSDPAADCGLCGWSGTWTGDHGGGSQRPTRLLRPRGRSG